MPNVYAWPPVGVTGHEWTEEAPVNTSRSLLTGARFVSAAQRKRRLVTMNVSSLARGRSGAGYVEVLKRLLAGGENLVRLHSYPINSWGDAVLYTGTLGATAGTSGGFEILTVTGLPPETLVARPGTFLTYYSPPEELVGETVMVMTEAMSDESGIAVIRLMSGLAGSGRVEIGTRDTGVFEAVDMPRAVQPVAGDWSYQCSFREVFADEVGALTEVDPW